MFMEITGNPWFRREARMNPLSAKLMVGMISRVVLKIFFPFRDGCRMRLSALSEQ